MALEQLPLPGLWLEPDDNLDIPEGVVNAETWADLWDEHKTFIRNCCLACIELPLIGDMLKCNLVLLFTEDEQAQADIKQWYAMGVVRSRIFFAKAALGDPLLMRLQYQQFLDRTRV